MAGSDPGSLLEAGLRELGLDDPAGGDALRRYIAELERWSPKLGLVNATGAELVVRHILDSLAGVPVVRELLEATSGRVVADAGAGGGLPGIPLACFLPDAEVLLVERSGKKCGFLRGAVAISGIRNARVIEADVKTLHETAHIVVLRAFHPLSPDTVTMLTGCLRPGGALCAYKGRRERIIQEMGEVAAKVRLVPVRVPFLSEERHLVIIREPRPGAGSSEDHPSPPDQ